MMDGGKLTHSQSQPGGMDRTPPGTPKKGGKMMAVRVQMLDDTITMFQVQAKALGRVLFDQVCSQLHLLESDYFGLEYQEVGGTKYWLDLEKPLSRQIGLSLVDTLVRFCVKFYTPDPSQLEEEFTRYLFCLQIKRDLSQGLLQCNNNTAALMASYIVQAECGDYVAEDYPDYRYLSSYKFVPNQDQELEKRIMENHKKHAHWCEPVTDEDRSQSIVWGQSPAEADLNLLETARRCELYGIKMHAAKDHEGVPLNLAVAHMGIVVFQNFTKINTFSWAKIRKISFKRKRFLVKLHPEGYGYYKDTVEFFFEGRNECKNFWKKCVENHGFFRCTTVKKVPRQKTRVLSRGSSFRYSGRTQKQIVDFVRENYVKRQTFQRSQSFRHSSSAHSSVANVGTSISAHPLLPLGENAVAGTPASLSCGSMTLTSSPIHAADIHAGALPSPPGVTSVSLGTSVTSSPQHFYPQENPYPRVGHQRAKVTHPRDHFRHGISPPQGPTNAATPATIHSANHSNDNIGDSIDDEDAKSCRLASDYANFNDVYSNCYSSLRSLSNQSEPSHFINHKTTKSGAGGNLSDANFVNGTSKSNESIRTPAKGPLVMAGNKTTGEPDLNWHRSASYKDLYREENSSAEKEDALEPMKTKSTTCYGNLGGYQVTDYERRSDTRVKDYPAGVVDRSTGVVYDLKMYPSSLSTESAEEAEVEVFDVKYDSQEEMVLSHDDISHDSYELLERDPGEYEDPLQRRKSRRVGGDNDRARSCSWGSDRGISPLDFRSTDDVLAGQTKSRDNGFWSLERERSPKHKSEGDFRSLERKNSRGFDECRRRDVNWSTAPISSRSSGSRRSRQKEVELEDLGAKSGPEDVFDVLTKMNEVETEVVTSKELAEREYLKLLEREPWVCSQRAGYDHDRMGMPERTKYQVRKKSLEKCEPFLMKVESEKPMRLEERRRLEKKREKKEEKFHEGIKVKEQREWEKEKERWKMERLKNLEKEAEEEERARGAPSWTPKDYSEFKEIHPKKFDRVVSNQFGKYSEFLTEEKKYDMLLHERKVMENYEKVCQVGKLAKELEMRERNNIQESPGIHILEKPDYAKSFLFSPLQQDSEKSSNEDVSYLSGRTAVERTKSDPFSSRGNLRRNVLMHQKSIDLTPQQSVEKAADQIIDDLRMTKTSRSEHDIPYILHKRHLNGLPTHIDLPNIKTEVKLPPSSKSKISDENSWTEDEDPLYAIIEPKKENIPPVQIAEGIKSPPQEITIDPMTDVLYKNSANTKKCVQPLHVKPPIGKKPNLPEGKSTIRQLTIKESRKTEPKNPGTIPDSIHQYKPPVRDAKTIQPDDKTVKPTAKKEEPIYAEVYRGNIIEKKEDKPNVPPQPPERTSSKQPSKPVIEETKGVMENQPKDMPKVSSPELLKPKSPPESFKTGVPIQKTHETRPPNFSSSSREDTSEEAIKAQPIPVRPAPAGSAQHKRKESLILFARTRLGLSEGSAFSPVRNKASPTSQRRTKSLDAPYVSLHRLPPADAFSSKDDTLDGNEDDVLPPVERVSDSTKKDAKPPPPKNEIAKAVLDRDIVKPSEVEPEPLFPEKAEIETNIKKWTEGDLKVELVFSEEKVLDGVRSRRLLSKIESLDGVDSEGDMDSSKLTDGHSIPSDRLVNLPESVRFPSVRQISGQTSEESADGWDQKEVKVKRRTPRRSVGREEPEMKESVVWDSKDDEMPDDDVWDENLVFSGKFEGPSMMTDTFVPVEYLKRGSCGQSIDDDNLSTPMKESSPEHWVSVDDLPEAIEREEKLLRQQEKILREKILNEKLKRELNLDTIDVDEKLYEYRLGCRQTLEEDANDFKSTFKGHSLDTYELTEKRLREKGTSKHSSLDEHILREKPIKNYVTIPSNFDNRDSFPGETFDNFTSERNIEYIECKLVNDLRDIDQFAVDNDEELEEFFVVLGEKPDNDKHVKNVIWENEDDDVLMRTESKDESVISVPEEFRDDADVEDFLKYETCERAPKVPDEETFLTVSNASEEPNDAEIFAQSGTAIKISSQEGTRSSIDTKALPVADDAGRLSPYECTFRRNSSDPRRSSASDEPDRLSPLNDLRTGGDESRRLSSEDSRKYSMSESASEETRRKLSSTEETRRKRASLTKQCSVGADSLTDEMVSGVPECNSSFEHDDEKDVFEAEVPLPARPKEPFEEPAEERLDASKDVYDGERDTTDVNLPSHIPPSPVPEPDLIFDSKNVEIEPALKEPENIRRISLQETPHRTFGKTVSHMKSASIPLPTAPPEHKYYSIRSSLDSSQESDIDKLSEVSLISHVQNQISRRNLSEAGKCLRNDGVDVMERTNLSSTDGSSARTSSEERGFNMGTRYSSEEHEKTESSSFEGKPSPEEGEKQAADKRFPLRAHGEHEYENTKSEGRILPVRDRRGQDEKRDSGEDGSSSSSAPPYPKRELSSTWKPFLLESSGSSSLEENWLPPDDNAHLADEEETSNTSQQDESGQDDLEYPTGIGYPGVSVSSAEMIVGGYAGAYALSRTLSRISERSTSEQERSDMEDDFTKPSSHSVSAEEESMLSSDRQPSLSSDPPSLRGSAARIPDLPDDQSFVSENVTISEEKKTVCEPFGGVIPPPLPDEDWPSPVSSPAPLEPPVGTSHIETVYLEIYPEEACKVVVAEPHNNEENSSSDENHTLHGEGEFLHLSSENVSMSTTTTTTTQDGTVIAMTRKSARAASFSEDASLISMSEWSCSTTSKPRPSSAFGGTDDFSDRSKNSSGRYHAGDGAQGTPSSTKHELDSKIPAKIKPPKLKSPTGKIGFFETPVSKVRSPTSQSRFFDQEEPSHLSAYCTLRSPTSRSESSSPKNCKRFFESPVHRLPSHLDSSSYESRSTRTSPRTDLNATFPLKCSQNRGTCTPYYSNVAEGAEKSFFGRYDTGSLERTKIIYSRKCRSYYSMARPVPDDDDSSNSEERRVLSSNTIPRASKRTKKRHRVAMDLEIRDGRIVAPPKTRATIVENTDSDRSSPRQFSPKETRKRHSNV